jgi:hypothetical protein
MIHTGIPRAAEVDHGPLRDREAALAHLRDDRNELTRRLDAIRDHPWTKRSQDNPAAAQ